MPKSVVRNILFIFLLITNFSCHKKVTKEELMKYINNPKHGLMKEKQINGVTYKLIYKAPELLALQESEGNQKLTKKLDSLISKYNKNLYVIFSITKDNDDILNSTNDFKNFGTMVDFLSFGMGNNMIITTSKNDTLPIFQFVYPRLYDMANSSDLLFCLKKPSLDSIEWIKFRFKDFGLATGDFICYFKAQDIQSVPQLKVFVKQ
jgi:hypothetical protein